MVCLDQGTDASAKRLGQQLPHRENIPPYSLFPYWTDLLIAQGKPHGIFWEATGTSPNRSLAIEWYVTRYNQEDQYFQFKLLVKEAEPNVVTFEYYNVRDNGVMGTIGVQGPSGEWSSLSHLVLVDLKTNFTQVTSCFRSTSQRRSPDSSSPSTQSRVLFIDLPFRFNLAELRQRAEHDRKSLVSRVNFHT
jgi:hypothetical protein